MQPHSFILACARGTGRGQQLAGGSARPGCHGRQVPLRLVAACSASCLISWTGGLTVALHEPLASRLPSLGPPAGGDARRGGGGGAPTQLVSDVHLHEGPTTPVPASFPSGSRKWTAAPQPAGKVGWVMHYNDVKERA